MKESHSEHFSASMEIRQRSREIDVEFTDLAAWIQSGFMVKVLNIHLSYMRLNGDEIPRLTIVLENSLDYGKFFIIPFMNDTRITNRIFYHTQEYLRNRNVKNIDRLLIVYNDFQRDYSHELCSRITKNELWSIIPPEHRTSVWDILNVDATIIVFFMTERQKNRQQEGSAREEIKDNYLRVLRDHDSFGYLDPGSVFVMLDSKENFEANYRGNWYYYLH